MLSKLAIGLVLVSLLAACAERHPPPSTTDAGAASPQYVRAGDRERAPGDSDVQATIDRQRDLMARALAGVAPSRADVPEFFFVGFAGWASEDVFVNEARAAADLFRRRFGADGRVLLLANNARTAGDLPLASVSNLHAAVQGVAGKMGAEDVLFLYLTSHGRPGRIDVRHEGFGLRDLHAGELRGILDDGGSGTGSSPSRRAIPAPSSMRSGTRTRWS
jgi:hypothetical protein